MKNKKAIIKDFINLMQGEEKSQPMKRGVCAVLRASSGGFDEAMRKLRKSDNFNKKQPPLLIVALFAVQKN
jgi:hypothetical protein